MNFLLHIANVLPAVQANGENQQGPKLYKRVQNLECKTMLVKHAFLASYRKVSVILRPVAGSSSNKVNQEKTA